MLLALHSDTCGMCFPGRDTITMLTGIYPSNASKATRVLEQLGWLSKGRRKGRSVIYRLKNPYLHQSANGGTDRGGSVPV